MPLEIIITLLYGVAIAAGGIVGLVKAKSLASLISGGGLGLLTILGTILWQQGDQIGYWLAVTATILVALFFGYQSLKALSDAKPFWRAVAFLSLSALELVLLFAS